MSQKEEFFEYINAGYKTKGDYIELGAAMLGEETITNAIVKIPLKTLNRHGLIAGATGTGKTKTLQVFAENLSEKGIPVLLMDIKGDLSGLAKASPGHPKIDERHEKIGFPFNAKKFPVEILSISEQDGTKMRATVSEFGPVLNEKGIPTPLVRTMLRAPMSRMDILTEQELHTVIHNSRLLHKYNQDLDRESAYEMLNNKIEKINLAEKEAIRAIEEKKRIRKIRRRRNQNNWGGELPLEHAPE